jgi:PAS domain S-box-containing protein
MSLPQSAELLKEFGANLGLMSVLLLAYALQDPVRLRQRRWSWGHVLLGLAFGLAAVLAQLSPLTLHDGLKTDARGVVLALAGAYAPPPSALLAWALASAYRLALGPPSGGLAVLGMAGAVLLGWLWTRWRASWPRPLWLLSLGLAVALMGLALVLLLPGGLGPSMVSQTALPVLLSFAVGTLALGLLLDRVAGHSQATEAMQQAQQQRQLSETHLALALQASGASIWEWHVAEQRMVLNQGFYEQLGYAPWAFEASFEQWRSMLHPDDAEAAITIAMAALRSPSGSYANEYRLRDGQGNWRWMLASGRVMRRGPDGRAQLMVGTHVDIDVSRRQQAALLESHERFQKIYQTTPDAMGMTRLSDGLYIDVNDAYLRLSGYSREEVVGHTAAELGIWADPRQRQLMMETFQRDGRVDSMEMRVRGRDGRRLEGLMSMRPLVEQGHDCLLFIYRDITERQRLRGEAEAARAEVAAAAAANRAKTEFLSRMSHELRTPLNAVLGFAQLLLAAPTPLLRERQRNQVESIAQAGWHLLELINDVLDITRIESGQLQLQLQTVDLAPLLDEALELLGPQAQEMDLRLDAGYRGEPLPALAADPVRLRQCLLNLLSNAIKYNRRGGRLGITAVLEAQRLRLDISDTGLGMSEQQLAHLFEPFNRLGREREAIEGTGIGLVLTRYLLELMGAELRLSSVAGEGTVASLSLPLASPDLLQQDLVPTAAPAVTTACATDSCLLYVEDNPVNRLLVQEMLSDWPGLSLHLADDGAQGLRRAAELCPDLLLLDMRLPDMDGIEVLRRLRAEPAMADQRVVALSASAMPDEVAQALAAGAEEYGTKPLQLQRFRADVARVLALAPVKPGG